MIFLEIFIILGEFLAFTTILGNPLRILLLRHSDLQGPNMSIEVRWVVSVATGVAFLTLIMLWLGLFPGHLSSTVILILPLPFIAWNAGLYRRQLRRFPTFLRTTLARRPIKSRWFIALLITILVFQMSALAGLWVTPGDDAKLYSLITRRVIESRGIPEDWGTYAPANWYVERTHLLLPGFSAVAAFFVTFSGSDVPVVVSVLASVFRSVAAATLYVLVWTFTRRRLPSLLAMSVYGLLVFEPTIIWFSWGGMAELSSISLLPIASAGTLLIAESRVKRRPLLWASLIVSGMSLLHPFAFFYYIAFALSAFTVFLWKKEWAKALKSWIPTVLGLSLAAGPILHAFTAEASIAASYSIYNPAWTPIFGLSATLEGNVAGLPYRTFTVYGFAAIILLVTGAIIARQALGRQKKNLAILGSWAFFLFLLHENNPNGLFLIPFPFWYRIDPNRTFSITSLAVCSVVGLLFGEVPKRILPDGQSPLRLSILRRLNGSRLRNNRRSRLFLLAVSLVALQVLANSAALYVARAGSPVETGDIQAFSWIQGNTSINATFFVNWADAGTWIPAFTGRRVAMPFGVVTVYSLLEDYSKALNVFITDPESSDAIQFLRSQGVNYVYAGPARIYHRTGFDPSRILSSSLYDEVYHASEVWIFRLR